MAEIIKNVILCELGKKSRRGFFFKEKAIREFLDSDTWKKRKEDKTALCSITHYSRRQSKNERDATGVGQRDYQLIDQTTVGTIIDLFIEDNFWIAKVKIFDPEKFEGTEAYKDIKYVNGLISSGVKLRSSMGCEGYYNPVTKECEKIYDMVGVDFTQSPDFSEGGIV